MGQSKFTPIRGSEETIKSLPWQNGALYFATDTRKIYLDGIDEATQNKIPMGGNSGIFYGSKDTKDSEAGQTEFVFNENELDIAGINKPVANDLILNIPDGCFYRVKSTDPQILAQRLTIAGGGGGQGSDITLGTFTLRRITPASETVRLGDSYQLTAFISAVNAAQESTGNGKYALFRDGVQVATGDLGQGEVSVDISNYLALDAHTYRIVYKYDIGGSDLITRSLNWTITATYFDLTWDYDSTTLNNIEDSLILSWSCSGSGLSKHAYIYIDGVCVNQELPFEFIDTSIQKYRIDNPAAIGLTHGAHTIGIQVSTKIGEIILYTDKIEYPVLMIDSQDKTPIISIGLTEDTLQQYTTINIPIIFYSVDNENGLASLNLIEKDTIVDTWKNVQNDVIYNWAYTPTEAGTTLLKVQYASVEEAKTVDIDSIGLNVDEVKDYVFKFKATDFSSNSAIESWHINNIKAQFSEKFDWVNGGLKTIDGERVFCIKAGSFMTITYPLFDIPPNKNGKTFKIILKATKCRDYDAEVLKCQDPRSNIGLVMRAQGATYKSQAETIDIPYSEDERIEFELDITKYETNDKGGRRYIMPWLDGVPCGIVRYKDGDSFTTSNTAYLTIGSEDCDVYIYLIKMYERHLTNEEHLSNFIVDATTVQDMIARYKRNDILDNSGEISYLKLAKANPNCQVNVYEIPRMTMNKKDKVSGCKFQQYQGSDQVKLSADLVTIKVQGTSSAAYGLAAYNLDSDFKQKKEKILNQSTGIEEEVVTIPRFRDGEGNAVNHYYIDENAIGIDYTTTKVNVASCEQANNAINQEWYNRFQPYVTLKRAKNSHARDTMQFKPGVLFIKDNNNETPVKIKNADGTESEGVKVDNVFRDTPGYMSAPFPKLYSICNMGNSKKNVQVFHDEDNPNECCIEVSDNQAPQQWMTSDNFSNDNIDPLSGSNQTEFFSFRYPEDYMDAVREKTTQEQMSDKIINAWKEFVSWMAHSNPQPMYEKHIILSEQEFAVLHQQEEKAANNTSITIERDVYYIDPVDKIHKIITSFDPNIQEYFVKTNNLYGYTDEPFTDDKRKAGVDFDPYTFKGYIADKSIQKDYKPIIAGTTINTYATNQATYFLLNIHSQDEFNKAITKYNNLYYYDNNNTSATAYQYLPISNYDENKNYYYRTVNRPAYTTDCYEYRMAKMLSECEDHLVMDSVLFHYLFIERHTMIDNVAKNTFWSTEDLQHWNLTKDYDNDTADGNDNNGHLTREYGLEPQDKLNDNTYVFNAREAVWFNFIHGLPEACNVMYNALDTRGAWSADPYLDAFKEWQDSIPERVWIENYYRLYIRPFEVYKDESFMEMLEGGKKTYQRGRFEKYQDIYMSSKYNGRRNMQGNILIRGNGQGMLGYKLPVKMYSDCYVNAAIGSGITPNVRVRAKRNETVNIICPYDNLNNTTFYMYPSAIYSEIGDENGNNLGDFLPEQISTSQAPKLRKLVCGTTGSKQNESLKSISFEANDQLETLYIQNCPNIESSLDLSVAPNMKYVNAKNSGFSSVIIADNAPIKEIHLEAPVTLKLHNLYNLEALDINNYQRLASVDLVNIDNNKPFSQEIISNMIINREHQLSRYNLNQVNWKIIEDKELDLTNELPTIKIIDSLLDEEKFKPIESMSTGLTQPTTISLTGDLNVSASAYNGDKTFEIQDQYGTSYPELYINFEGGQPLYNITIYDGTDNIVWHRKIAEGQTITEHFLSAGPNGAFDKTRMNKASTSSQVFNFKNVYEVFNADTNELLDTIENEMPIYNKVITSNISIKPIFDAEVRTYEVHFYNGSVELQSQAWDKFKVPYGTLVADLYPLEIPQSDATTNELKEAYDFIGYSQIKNSLNVIKSDMIVEQNLQLYSSFKLVPDITKVIHPEYFKYTAIVNGGVLIEPQDGMILPKKITIPTFVPSNTTQLGDRLITAIGLFNAQQTITHIFFEDDTQIQRVNAYAFQNSNLEYFDFAHPSLEEIGVQAFQSTRLSVFNFVEGLKRIDQLAFNASGPSKGSPITIHIPSSVENIGPNAFVFMKLPSGSGFILGSQNNRSRWNILSGIYSGSKLDSIHRFTQNQTPKLESFVFYSALYSSLEEAPAEDNPDLTVKDAIWLASRTTAWPTSFSFVGKND